MMMKNGLYIQQNLVAQSNGYIRNEYHFYADWDNCLGGFYFPNNGDYKRDEEALEDITHALAVRWGLISSSKKREQHNNAKIGIAVKTVDNVYQFYSMRGHYLGCLLFPADNQYLENMLTLEEVIYTLGRRWGVVRTIQKKRTGKAGR